MKTTEVTLRFLEADEGYLLRNKEDKTIISEKVSLSIHDSTENWEEVDKETAELEKKEIEEVNNEQNNDVIEEEKI